MPGRVVVVPWKKISTPKQVWRAVCDVAIETDTMARDPGVQAATSPA